MKRLGLIVLAFLLTGCATGGKVETLSFKGIPEKFAQSVSIKEGESNVDVPQEHKDYFANELKGDLYGKDSFRPGDDLIISYRFVDFEEGSRAARFFVPGPFYFLVREKARASVTIESEYLKPNGESVLKIRVTGNMEHAGSIKTVMEYCADKIAKYAKMYLKK